MEQYKVLANLYSMERQAAQEQEWHSRESDTQSKERTMDRNWSRVELPPEGTAEARESGEQAVLVSMAMVSAM